MISFEDAYFFMWLAKSPVPYRHLSFSAEQLRERIETALAGGIVPIGPMLNGIIEISNGSTDPFERAEINLVCARSFFIMGDFNNALNQLDAAGEAYRSAPHDQAVISWMKGCVLLEMPGDIFATIQLWQRSLDKFNRLAKSQSVQREGAEWYEDWCAEMEDSINEVMP